MLVPSRKNRGLFELMTDPFDILADVQAAMPKPLPSLMKTDIKETDKGYELDIEIPGYHKKDVDIEVKDGYLIVSATKEEDEIKKDEKGTFIRKERFSGKSSRSFYIGDDIKHDDIKASLTNGVLKIEVPKKDEKPKEEVRKTVAIEG